MKREINQSKMGIEKEIYILDWYTNTPIILNEKKMKFLAYSS